MTKGNYFKIGKKIDIISEEENRKIEYEILKKKCFNLIGVFETSAKPPKSYSTVSGNFDEQGISLGILQWNLGQKTLQPLLIKFISENYELAKTVFQDKFEDFKNMLTLNIEEQIHWGDLISEPLYKRKIISDYEDIFDELGKTQEFQAIQIQVAQSYFDHAKKWFLTFDLKSERAFALMFDICVQNGGFKDETKNIIMDEVADKTELEKMITIANRRAEASGSRWIEDVRTRKLCIANGKGTVHGIYIELERDFGITVKDAFVC